MVDLGKNYLHLNILGVREKYSFLGSKYTYPCSLGIDELEETLESLRVEAGEIGIVPGKHEKTAKVSKYPNDFKQAGQTTAPVVALPWLIEILQQLSRSHDVAR